MWNDAHFWFGEFLWFLSIFGIASGTIITVSAVNLKRNPKERTVYGILIIIFSVLSIVASGGFIIGTLLGVMGGIFSVSGSA
ncbi:MAG: DUF6114 domain-containing protein [Nitrososphaeria archaeon]